MCPQCKRVFKTSAGWDRHPVNCLQCVDCGEGFRTYSGMHAHRRLKHREPHVPCICCKQKFANWSLRNQHFYREECKRRASNDCSDRKRQRTSDPETRLVVYQAIKTQS